MKIKETIKKGAADLVAILPLSTFVMIGPELTVATSLTEVP